MWKFPVSGGLHRTTVFCAWLFGELDTVPLALSRRCSVFAGKRRTIPNSANGLGTMRHD